MTLPDLHDPLLLLLAGLAIDAVFGEMPAIFARVPHPVALAGRAIALFERKLNRPQRSDRRRRERGIITVIVLVGGAAGFGWVVARAVPRQPRRRRGRGIGDRHPAGAAQPVRACRGGRRRARSRRADGRPRRSEPHCRPRPGTSSTGMASRAPRSRAWPRISATAWWRRRCGISSPACRACSPTRWPTRSTA